MTNVLSNDQVVAVARQLAESARTTTPVEAMGVDPGDRDCAYRIQDAGHGLHDDPLVGWKVGCTSAAAQQLIGVNEPVAGRYRRLHVLHSPASIRSSELVSAPYLEVEVGFRLLADIDASPTDAMDLADVVEVFAAIEVVAGRLAWFPLVTGPDLIADNVVAARMIVGPTLELDAAGVRALDTVRVELDIDAKTVASGVGADALGHPLKVLSWLARHAARRGVPLHEDDLVITGTCTGMVPAQPGAMHVGRVGGAELSLSVM